MSRACPFYSFATHFKDWDEKSVGVKVNWLQQNMWRIVAIWLWCGDCVLSPKCFSLNASLCHLLATHPCTSCRFSQQIHCSSIHQMDFYLHFYLAKDSEEGKVLRCCCFFFFLHGSKRQGLHFILIIRITDWTLPVESLNTLNFCYTRKYRYVELIHIDATIKNAFNVCLFFQFIFYLFIFLILFISWIFVSYCRK